MAGETRCVCGREEDGGLTMVEWYVPSSMGGWGVGERVGGWVGLIDGGRSEECRFWLHIKCLGYERRTLPKVFVCTFCRKEGKGRGRARGG